MYRLCGQNSIFLKVARTVLACHHPSFLTSFFVPHNLPYPSLLPVFPSILTSSLPFFPSSPHPHVSFPPLFLPLPPSRCPPSISPSLLLSFPSSLHLVFPPFCLSFPPVFRSLLSFLPSSFFLSSPPPSYLLLPPPSAPIPLFLHCIYCLSPL